jgi:Holliday junction resolvase-like predicted endonuclease
MDIIENIVANWFNSKGYFLIKNLKVGVNEIDILAIRLNSDQKINDAVHIEVQCSSNPIGYIGGTPSAKKRDASEVELGVAAYIEKKFNNKKITDVIKNLVGNKYRKMFICGKLKEEDTVKYFEKNGIMVKRVWEIFKEIKNNAGEYKTGEGNRYHQLLHLNDQN